MIRNVLIAIAFLSNVGIAYAQETTGNVVTAREERRQRRVMPATKNVFAISPVHITENNVGLGLNFEHFLDNEGTVSLYLPLSYAIANNSNNYDDYYYGSYYSGMPLQHTYSIDKGLLYFYPGIKIYPFGTFKKLSYSVGGNMLAAFGSTDLITSNYGIDTINYPGGGVYYNTVKTSEIVDNVSRVKLGVLISNSLNLRPTNHLYLGFELALGYTYLNKIGSLSNGSEALVQAGVKFGYIK